MSTINQKLGFKPKTKVRAATHSVAIVANQRCAACGSQHVLRTLSVNGRRLGAFWCGGCSAFFDAPAVGKAAA